ncbi:MAG: hypothetical protein IJC86_03645 [Clostridia bacterium]|nr:hypothetical protein [Clostridia bacterium]
MKLELLYPQICNLYGDLFNIKYLASCSSDINVTETLITDTPLFMSEDVDMIYLGAMSENSQQLVINALRPYRERIAELIDKGTVFLCTGNATEVFGKYIETDEKEQIEALSIFDVYSVRRMMKRHNSNFMGKFEDMNIVGFKSQFTMMYGDNSDMYFSKAEKGIGINPDTMFEGIRKNNFFGTYLIGPLLILNPDFTEYLLRLTGVSNYTLPHCEQLINAYNRRVEELRNI